MSLTKVTYAMIEGASVNVLDYGATGNGTTDDTAAIQAAINYASSLENGGSVVIPYTNAYYSVSCLIAKSNVSVIVPNRNTKIVSENGAAFDTQQCWTLGGYYGSDYLRPTAYNIAAINIGDYRVQLSTAGDSANFIADDIVWIETIENYTVGTYPVPVFCQLNVVTGTTSGYVNLKYGVQGSYSSCRIRRFTRTGLTTLGGTIPLNAVHNFKLLGGTWVNGSNAPFCSNGGIIDSEISPDVVDAEYGCLYGNCFAHVTSNVKTVKTKNTPIGLALGAHNTVLNVDNISVYNDATIDRFVELSESCRDCKITIGSITAIDDVNFAVDVIAARRNEININSIICPSILTAGVRVWGPAYVTATGYAQTTDNKIIVNSVHCPSIANTTQYIGNTSPYTYCDNNYVNVNYNAIFSSSTPISTPSNKADYNITNVKTLSYWYAKYLEFYEVSTGVTFAAPYSKTLTYEANTLKNKDELRLTLKGIATGTSGTKTITISFAGTTVYTGTIAASSDQGFDVQSVIYINGNTEALANITSILETSASVDDTGVTGLNFTTTNYNLVISVTCASAGDTLNLREASLQFYRPYSNDLYLYGR
jgi:hypothetical protein